MTRLLAQARPVAGQIEQQQSHPFAFSGERGLSDEPVVIFCTGVILLGHVRVKNAFSKSRARRVACNLLLL
jgi:hypothetical protein